MKKDQVSVEVLVFDKPARKFSHEDRTYVEARLGEFYQIKIKNNSSERILAVVSVDGLNSISGEKASHDSVGYIICGYSSYIVPGFRVSNDKVNCFQFVKKEESYVAKIEDSEGFKNCGVIGVAIFSQKQDDNIWKEALKSFPKQQSWPHDSTYPWPTKTPYPYPYGPNDYTWPMYPSKEWEITCSTENAAPIKTNNVLRCASLDAGTAFSSKEIVDKVSESKFERGPLEGVFDIYYATRSMLEEIGIKFNKQAEIAYPESFPSQKFCKPPK